MFVVRWTSIVMIVIAVMLLGADLVSTLEMRGMVVVRSLDHILQLFRLDMKPGMLTTFPAPIANIGVTVVSWPAWVIFGILGFVLALLAPTPKPARPTQPPPLNRR